jgi:hypothetical protein
LDRLTIIWADDVKAIGLSHPELASPVAPILPALEIRR